MCQNTRGNVSVPLQPLVRIRELTRLTCLFKRNLRWWRRTTTAPTTPSSREAQSTSRTWSDDHGAAGQRSAATVDLVAVHSFHQQTYSEKGRLPLNGRFIFFFFFSPQDFERLLGHIHIAMGVDKSPQLTHLDERRRGFVCFWSPLCTKMEPEAALLGVLIATVSIPRCHTHTHSALSTLQLPYSLAFLHWRGIRFILWLLLISYFLSYFFLFLVSMEAAHVKNENHAWSCVCMHCHELLPSCYCICYLLFSCGFT